MGERRRLATILALDVVGYSALIGQEPDALLSHLNRVFRTIVRPRVKASQGRIAKLTGDGAIVEFGSARNAILCAEGIQSDLRADASPDSRPGRLALRMGIHAGDVVVEGGDVFGDGVNIAARLESAAGPGEIFVSRMVVDLAGAGLSVGFRAEGLHRFKNIDRPIEVLAVLSDDPVGDRRQRRAGGEDIRFARADDGLSLAWTATGDGPPLVKAPAWISQLDLDWRNPSFAHVIDHFSRTRRLVRFDARGNGLSDREMPRIDFDLMVEDLRAVFDAAGLDRAPILAFSQGCAVSAAFAVRYPERVSAIMMIGGFPLGRGKRNSSRDREQAAAFRAMMRAGWDDDHPSLRDLVAEMIVPLASAEERRQFAEDMRAIISPETMARYRAALDEIDVTPILGKVQAPCLVMHCKEDRMQPVDQGRRFAAGLPRARFVAYDSANHTPTENDPCWHLIRRDIDAFLAEQGDVAAGG